MAKKAPPNPNDRNGEALHTPLSFEDAVRASPRPLGKREAGEPPATKPKRKTTKKPKPVTLSGFQVASIRRA